MNTFACGAAILAALSFSVPAIALELNPQGLGQVLMYPYYTVNKNQDTYFSVANYGSAPQVVKVRFLEGRNGRPVLDLDVVLSPHDTWTAAVSAAANGGAKLVTRDDSCTRPLIPAAGLGFTSSGYDGSSNIPADNGSADISRTREGFAEVIGGASIFMPFDGSHLEPMPIDCSTIFNILSTNGVLLDRPGALVGSASIIDVAAGRYYGYNADAIDEFTDRSLFSPDWGPLKPSLADAYDATNANHPVAFFFAQNSGVPNHGQPQRGEYDNGVDAISAVLMADSIQNDFLIDPGLGANTDWVVTFPTRRFYTDPIYPVHGHTVGSSSLFEQGYAPMIYDRRGANATSPAQGNIALHDNVNVISFVAVGAIGAPSGVFGSSLNTNVAATASSGMMRLDVGGPRTGQGGDSYQKLPFDAGGLFGVPMTGFMAYNIINAHAQPGLLANYGAVFAHRRTTCATGAWINSFICQY